MIHFEWDPHKAVSNRRKHRVGFEEAISVFDDPLAAIFDDPDHSGAEPRELIVGRSIQERLLVVSFTIRQGSTVRIISARQATRRERVNHEENANR